MLDFSRNKEVQDTIQRRDFFTNQCSERIYIDMRESLGYTGQKDPMTRDDSSIKLEITLKEAANTDYRYIDNRSVIWGIRI